MNQQKIMYGEHAAQVTVTLPDGSSHQQWFCTRCCRIWGAKDQHMASWCCCTHRICECGNEHEKHWTMCDDCHEKRKTARWYANPEVIWNGEWPLALLDSDHYFFDESALIDYIEENFEEDSPKQDVIDSMWLTTCSPNEPPYFEVSEWCGDDLPDDLPDDHEIPDAESIDERINVILAEVGIISWSMECVRLNVRDVLERIGFLK